MKALLCFAAIVVSLGQPLTATFEAQEATCGLKFQSILEKAVNLRKRCDNAAYRDCCQVSCSCTHSYTYAVFTIKYACTLNFLQIKHFDPAAISGPYELFHLCETRPLNFGVTKVYAACDMEADEGGWIVIMRRNNGSVDFNRTMEEYEFGFGEVTGEFWYGLKNIHCLTNREPVELRIEIGNGTEPSIIWEYQTFRVATEPYYTLTVSTGKGVGDTYDAFYDHRSQHFFTYDRDRTTYKCAKNYGAGWWYINNIRCLSTNLNGKYEPAEAHAKRKVSWYTASEGAHVHYTHVSMKVRPKSCAPCEA